MDGYPKIMTDTSFLINSIFQELHERTGGAFNIVTSHGVVPPDASHSFYAFHSGFW